MVELADAPDSKSGDGDIVRVQVPPSAPVCGWHYGRKKIRRVTSSVFLRHVFAPPHKCLCVGQSELVVTQSNKRKRKNICLLSDLAACKNDGKQNEFFSETFASLSIPSLPSVAPYKSRLRHQYPRKLSHSAYADFLIDGNALAQRAVLSDCMRKSVYDNCIDRKNGKVFTIKRSCYKHICCLLYEERKLKRNSGGAKDLNQGEEYYIEFRPELPGLANIALAANTRLISDNTDAVRPNMLKGSCLLQLPFFLA